MKGTSADATTVLGVQNNPGSQQRYDFRGKPTMKHRYFCNSYSGNMTLTETISKRHRSQYVPDRPNEHSIYRWNRFVLGA
jgi:hypothetical protein